MGSSLCPTANAYISQAPPQNWELPLTNDFTRCDQPVRKSILRARQLPRWGKFQFDCGTNTVLRIQTPLNSGIVSHWPTFVKENADMFGIDPATVRVGPQDGPIRTVYQVFNGAEIIPPDIFGSHPFSRHGMNLIIRTDFIKTKGWALGVPISSRTAIGIVQDELERKGAAIEVGTTKFMILTNQPLCMQCPFNYPSAVWSVRSADGKVSCLVDSVTGKVCEPCSVEPLACSF